MFVARRLLTVAPLLALLALLLAFAGCQSSGLLHPRNTWKLNRGPALDEDAYFSISDPIGDEAPAAALTDHSSER